MIKAIAQEIAKVFTDVMQADNEPDAEFIVDMFALAWAQVD